MSFASFEFLTLLIFTLSVFYFLPQRLRILLLLIVSYVFYCYWKPIYGLLILFSTVIDYWMAILIERERKLDPENKRNRKKLFLLTSIFGNVGLLAYFKYTDFALASLKSLLGPLGLHLSGPLNIILPIGISFYTFQTLSYTIDVYKGRTAERDFFLVALYVNFFPQLIAGPIEKAHKLMPQFKTKATFSWLKFEEGLALILWGYVKKVVFADRLIIYALPAHQDPHLYTTGQLAYSALAMMVVIYLDFSAYSQIARGTAKLFGIELIRNFEFPHAAANFGEFWRRWHISMSIFVRDYIYRPLGGFRPRSTWHHIYITVVTMSLVGLWHGANWTFVVWGLMNGLVMISYQLMHIHVLRKWHKHIFFRGIVWLGFSWVLTISIRMAINILFFTPTFDKALTYYERLYFNPTLLGWQRPEVVIGFFAIVLFWIIHITHYNLDKRKTLATTPPYLRSLGYTLLFFTLMVWGLQETEVFIYFQF